MRPPNKVRKPHNFPPTHSSGEGNFSDGSISSIRTHSSSSDSESSLADLLQQIANTNRDVQDHNSNPNTKQPNRNSREGSDSDTDFHGFPDMGENGNQVNENVSLDQPQSVRTGQSRSRSRQKPNKENQQGSEGNKAEKTPKYGVFFDKH